jgi:hypothetical protein
MQEYHYYYYSATFEIFEIFEDIFCQQVSKIHYCLVSLMWMKIGSNDITAQVPGVF